MTEIVKGEGKGRGSVRNVVIELNWLKKTVNNMFLVADWLNILVDMGENRVTSFKLTKYDFAAVCLDTWALLSFWTRMKT
jgi:hypothetical protein